MRKLLTFMILVAGSLATPAFAGPILYRLDVIFSNCTIQGVDEAACGVSDPVRAGITYSGHFTIDEVALATDGYKNAGFESFYFELGGTIWDSLRPYDSGADSSDYSGSRFFNPAIDPPSDERSGFGPWTLHVQDGELVGICCGVYGAGDIPFMDLYSWSLFEGNPISFVSVLAEMGTGAFGGPVFFAQGAFSIHRVPEPAPLVPVLLAFGLLFARKLLDLRSGTSLKISV